MAPTPGPSRARDIGRRWLSGAEKLRNRKKKEESFQQLVNKTSKLTTFFPKKVENRSEINPGVSNEIETNKKCTSESDSNANFETENPDDSIDRQSIYSELESEYPDPDSVDSSVVCDPDPNSVDSIVVCEDPEKIIHGSESTKDYNNVTHEHDIEKTDSNFECEQNNVNAIDGQHLFSIDIGKWPKDLSKCHIDYWIEKGSSDCQHKDSDFTLSVVTYAKNAKRFCGRQFFEKVLPKTNEKLERTWLCYSKSKKKTFLFPMYSSKAFRWYNK